MNKKNFLQLATGLCMALLVLNACDRDDESVLVSIEPPVIDHVSRQAVQAGEELTIYGSGLSREALTTEVLLSGRPAELVRQTADSLVIVVPVNAYSGNLQVILSQGKAFAKAEGPSILVRPTPVISGFYPLSAYAGETIALAARNFGELAGDNEIFLGAEKLELTGSRGKDTLLVKLPANAATGTLSWRSYNGPLYTLPELVFGVRKTEYAVNTIADWISADPGFSFLDTLIKGYPVLAGNTFENTHRRIFDTALNYLRSPERAYTAFLAGDLAYLSTGLSRTQYVNNIKTQPSGYNSRLVSAIIPGQVIDIHSLVGGEIFTTAYTHFLYRPPSGDPNLANKVRVVIQNGQPYVQVYADGNPAGLQLRKIIRQHVVGNATLIELDGDLGTETAFF